MTVLHRNPLKRQGCICLKWYVFKAILEPFLAALNGKQIPISHNGSHIRIQSAPVHPGINFTWNQLISKQSDFNECN